MAENTAAGEDIGNPVAANDANGDTLAYTLGGTDAASFDIGSATGQLMTKEDLDYETKSEYMVTVTATDPHSASDMITVTITVTNEEETGEVTLWLGTVALTTAPSVNDTITGAVMDPDVPVNVTAWQWARTMTPDVMASWMDIQDATTAGYTVMEGDTGYHLRVMATYDDGEGMGKMDYSPPTMMVMMVTSNNAPVFQDDQGMDITETTRMVAENTDAGENVGAPVMAMDADNDTLTYSLGGTDMASFTVDNMGQIMVGAGTMLDYETKASYEVMVTATDGTASDTVNVTIMVTDVMLGEPADTYDADKDEMISRDEVIRAISRYFSSRGVDISRDEVIIVITAYFRSLA